MKSWMRLMVFGLAFSQLSLAMAEPQSTSTNQPPKQEVRTALSATLSSFTPFGPDPDFNLFAVISQVYDTLINIDADGNLVPGLATRWVQWDPLTWRFFLRRDVTFHNGASFTSQDVKATLDYLRDPKNQVAIGWLLDAIESVTVVDDYTVQLKTRWPEGLLLHRLASYCYIVSKDDMNPTGLQRLKTNPMGTGPFKWVSAAPENEYVLEANPNYWRKGIPAYSRLRFVNSGDSLGWEEALMADKVDVATPLWSPPTLALRDPDILLSNRSVLDTQWVLLRTQGPLADIRVRQALNLAVDRQRLIQEAAPGTADPLASASLVGEFGHNDTLTPYPYDPDQARQLLKQAGQENLKLTAWVSQSSSAVAKSLKEQWAGIGVDLAITERPQSDFNDKATMDAESQRSGVDLFVVYGNNSFVTFALPAAIQFHSQWGPNLLFSPVFDRQWNEAVGSSDMSTQEQRLKALDKVIYDNYWCVPTFQYKDFTAYHKKLKVPPLSLTGNLDQRFLSEITFEKLSP